MKRIKPIHSIVSIYYLFVFVCRLPFVEYIFYDSSYKDRSPTQKFINNLSRLEELGDSVTDDKLQQVKSQVKPDFIAQHFSTSVYKIYRCF